MDEDRDLVVHSNELVEANYKLGINELRLINLALSKIDSRGKNPGVIRITPSEYKSIYQLSGRSAYENLRDAVKSIMRNPIALPYVDKRGVARTRELPWFGMADYPRQAQDAHISVRFSEEVTPYLFDLRERFTALNFEQASRLNTPFSFRLYQWLAKAKLLDKHQHNGTVVVALGLDWMRTKAGIAGYPEWRDMKKWLVDPAVDAINQRTELSVIYEPVKEGRKTTAVKFTYLVERATDAAKPARPRLARRPKAKPGSDKEGQWAKTNRDKLLGYREALRQYDSSLRLEMADLKRLAEYFNILGDTPRRDDALRAIKARQKRRKA